MKEVRLGGGLYIHSNEINVQIKKLSDKAVVPVYHSEQASGCDLVASEDVTIMPGETSLIPIGLAFQLPSDYELQIRPRSGLSAKTKFRVLFGTVDSDYRGEVKIIADNTGTAPFFIKQGDRIAQGVFAPVIRGVFQVVEELEETERNKSGFGSSGT